MYVCMYVINVCMYVCMYVCMMRATLGKITRVTPQNNFSELF